MKINDNNETKLLKINNKIGMKHPSQKHGHSGELLILLFLCAFA